MKGRAKKKEKKKRKERSKGKMVKKWKKNKKCKKYTTRGSSFHNKTCVRATCVHLLISILINKQKIIKFNEKKKLQNKKTKKARRK